MKISEIARVVQQLAATDGGRELFASTDEQAKPMTVQVKTRSDGQKVLGFYVDDRLQFAVATREDK